MIANHEAGEEASAKKRLRDEEGHLAETVIWQVEPNTRQPDGVRYRLAFVRSGETHAAVRYDNHHPKGHHRYVEGREEPCAFTDPERLIEDFQADMERARRQK
jgi:hypothetical protein